VHPGKRRPSVAWLAPLVVMCHLASAQDDGRLPNSASFAFDIPAQSLASALQDYGQATGVQVLYESNLADGRLSEPVKGMLTPRAALNVLLAGTDLKVRYARPNAITLAAPRPDDADAPPRHLFAPVDLSLDPLLVEARADDEERARRAFSDAVRTDVEGALRRNSRTRTGNYRLGVDLWIDSAGIVRRVELFHPTGDQVRDAAAMAAMQGLAIRRQAPPNTPLPVHVFVVVKPLQAAR
jgi:hypothetical protein